LYEQYGYLTYVVDAHSCEFLTPYLTDLEMMKKYKIGRKLVSKRGEYGAGRRKFVSDLAAGREKIIPRSRETAIDIMKARVTNTPFIDVVNLPNIGQIDNLPRGAVVETLGLVDGAGFAPISIGPLPEVLRRVTEVHCQIQKMTLEAALTGNRKLAFEALMLDPLCAKLPPSQIKKMGQELMSATGKYLPQFK
jgi:alpha-galactosidase